MKKYLNREQSKELIELGISPDKASLVSWKSIKDWQGNSILGKEQIAMKPFRAAVMGFEDFDCQDIFTIGDLIALLPKYINDDQLPYNLYIEPYTGNEGWIVSYDDKSYNDTFKYYHNNELVFALFEMVKYCITNKLITYQ